MRFTHKRHTKIIQRIFSTLLAVLLIGSAAPASNGYSDVAEADWFYSTISTMSDANLLNGYPDGTFRPNSTITAAELISVIARMTYLTEASAQNQHWAGRHMQAALNAGWYDWDELPPTAETYDQPIIRQLAVKIVMNAFAPGATGDYNTQSAKISDFSQLDGRYYNPVIAAYEAGIVYGDKTGCFHPKGYLTRAEACALLTRAAGHFSNTLPAVTIPPAASSSPAAAVTPARGGIAANGWLSVNGTTLVNQSGEPVVLHGMSTHGIQWYPEFLTEAVFQSVKDNGGNLIRLAMYTQEGGYLSKPSLKQTVMDAVQTATAMDLYVIIDWHILSDGNPNTYRSEANAFFTEMARTYQNNPGVLFELCNEPNGNVSWNDDVKPYAAELISAIRGEGSKAVILVGSPTWSQDIHQAAANPLDAENIMYTCHFYAGTHGEWLRTRIADAMAQGLPIFVSEWGTSDASGGGGVYLEESQAWIEFMKQNQLSWANWSLCDKNEASAAIIPGANCTDGISADELTASGRFVWQNF